MRQVLLNLLANALNVSPPKGRITLNSQLSEEVWRITMDDEGPGLSTEQCAKLFERFVRFHPPGSDEKGSGLGLAICRSIVKLHRGEILATPGQGGRGLHIVIEIPSGVENESRLEHAHGDC